MMALRSHVHPAHVRGAAGSVRAAVAAGTGPASAARRGRAIGGGTSRARTDAG